MIQFINGPVDGHVQHIPTPPKLLGIRVEQSQRIALYELDHTKQELVYRFMRYISDEELTERRCDQ